MLGMIESPDVEEIITIMLLLRGSGRNHEAL